jgi:predicted permease
LVVVQIALSLLVLACAGLCIRSVKKLQGLDPGFEPSRVVLMSFDLSLNDFKPARASEFYDRLLDRVRRVPGVEAASLSANTPLNGRVWRMSIARIEGAVLEPNEPSAEYNIIGPDYFRVLGASVLRGWEFSSIDSATSTKSVIVNEAFVRRYWPDQDPIGKRLFRHGPAREGTATEVVGVVGGIRSGKLTQAPGPAMYFPVSQWPELALTLTVRTGLEPSATIRALRSVVKSLDQNVPVFAVQTLEQQRSASLALERMAATLLGGFGALGLLLAALGIYGVLAYTVSRRTREIGVRMAVGAQVGDVLRLILREGIGLAAAGVVLGLIGAFGATRLLRGFLYEVMPLDPLTFTVVTLMLASIALPACHTEHG